MTRVTKSINEEHWENAVYHAKKIKAEHWARDNLIEKETEQKVIKHADGDLESDSCSSSSESFSSRYERDDHSGYGAPSADTIYLFTQKSAFIFLHCIMKVWTFRLQYCILSLNVLPLMGIPLQLSHQ
jgi:hypothetical protein